MALAALIDVNYLLDAADQLQRAQSARDSYRAHLALASQHAEFARPQNACILVGSRQGGAYVAFIDHLLYSAEQMLVLDEAWKATFFEQLAPHKDYVCSSFAPSGATEETASLLTRFRNAECQQEPSC